MPDRSVLVLTPDLMFSSNIEATLRRTGRNVIVVEDLAALKTALSSTGPGLVILDLHAGIDATDVIALTRESSVPVLAFGRHTEPVLLRSAREAGCAEVVPRSTFVQEMASLVDRVART